MKAEFEKEFEGFDKYDMEFVAVTEKVFVKGGGVVAKVTVPFM